MIVTIMISIFLLLSFHKWSLWTGKRGSFVLGKLEYVYIADVSFKLLFQMSKTKSCFP